MTLLTLSQLTPTASRREMNFCLQKLSVGVPLTEGIVFGVSRKMYSIRNKLDAIAVSTAPVLILGESGTGKDLMAAIIHYLSSTRGGPFVKISCPAVPGPMFESELFGCERGALAGAEPERMGRLEMADGGTLFVDGIGELSWEMQAKLLQVVQEGKFSPLGSASQKKVDVRVICATSHKLEEEVKNKNFREDLFHRVSAIKLTLPPLRERAEDIPWLIDYFVSRYNHKFNRRTRPISGKLVAQMKHYHWPGNIRQLESLIKRYVVLGSEQEIAAEVRSKEELFTLAHVELEEGDSVPLKKITKRLVRDVERQVIANVLQRHRWNRRRAARTLQISYRALLYKVKEARIVPPVDFEPSSDSVEALPEVTEG